MKPKLAFSLIELSIVILVIGILVTGITQGSRIISSSRLTTANSLSKSSPVASMDKLLMWYDATSKDSYVNFDSIKSGDTITALKDSNPQSTNKNDLTGTASYLENAINGLPAIDFNGSTQSFDSLTANSASGSAAIIAVLNADDVTTLSGIVTSYGAWAVGSIHFNAYNGRFESAVNPGGGSKFITPTVQTAKPYIITIICDPSGKISGYVNSVAATPYTDAGNVAINLKISIGKWFDGASNTRFFNGKIGEVMIFNRAVKDNERTAVEDYLSRKWSIALQ